MGRGIFSWSFLLGGCARVEDIPSPDPSPPPPPRKLVKQSSYTRVSCSDIGSATTPEELSSLSSSLLGANLHVFTMAEMTAATQGFSAANFIGKGGFGPVYKGYINNDLRPGLQAQTVAVKKLDLKGMQGHKEWLTEVILLGQLRHPHLVKLIGYCYEDDNRLLAYEFMAHGSLENHLFNKYLVSLPWEKRIKIAVGAARGLEFLHGVDQPVIYRDFKASNILLDSEFKAKLSDFGLAKDGPQGDDTHVSTRIMGTHGYAAPEYIMTGHLTAKSDVYSFGVVLLELITGRPSVDKSRPNREKSLVDWAKPLLNDPRKLNRIIDPCLEGRYSLKGVQKAAALAHHCLNHLPKSRPTMSMVVEILEAILEYNDIPIGTFVFTVKDDAEKVEKVNMKGDLADHVAKHTDDYETENTLESKDNKRVNDLHDQNQSHKQQQHRKKTENGTHRHHRRRHDERKQRHSTTQPVRYTDSALYTKPSKRQHNRDI